MRGKLLGGGRTSFTHVHSGLNNAIDGFLQN
jgi:hypothetical protein